MSRQQQRSWLVRSVLVVAAAALVLALALALWVWKNPLALYERSTRKALVESGLERSELATGSGTLVVWQGGQGPLLVLLHGAGDQAGAWAKVAAGLIDGYRLVIADLPGHGESDPRAGPLKMAEIFGGVAALLETAAEKEPPIVVGNSLGAWLAMVYAHRYPQRVGRVVAVNGGAIANDPGELSLTPASRQEARRLMAALRDPSSPEVPGFVLDDIVDRAAAGPIGRLMEDLEGMQQHLLDGRLEEISVPVDLLWGEADRLMTVDYARRMVAELPRARLTVIPSCGHVPQNECPERFLEHLEATLGAQPPAAEARFEEAAPQADSSAGAGGDPG